MIPVFSTTILFFFFYVHYSTYAAGEVKSGPTQNSLAVGALPWEVGMVDLKRQAELTLGLLHLGERSKVKLFNKRGTSILLQFL